MAEDYYKTLGLRRNASQDEIRKAYRELARKYHPDMNPDDKTAKKKFQEVQTAFDVLDDAEKREMYDRYGSSFETFGSDPRGGTNWQTQAGGGGFTFDDIDFSQIFGSRFGGGPGGGGPGGGFADLFGQSADGARAGGRKRARRPSRGADVRHELTIPFTLAVTGGEVEIGLKRRSGKSETIAVKIPPGIEEGKKIRLRGQGEPALQGGTPGDLLLTVRVLGHPCFQRRGNQLHVKLPVTLAEAALGAKVDVPTPKGTVSLKVPPGTSSGTKLRIKAHGVAPAKGPTGDLLAEIQIVLPDTLDDESREMIRKIGEKHAVNARADVKW
jgi:curved DNA-binding protein